MRSTAKENQCWCFSTQLEVIINKKYFYVKLSQKWSTLEDIFRCWVIIPDYINGFPTDRNTLLPWTFRWIITKLWHIGLTHITKWRMFKMSFKLVHNLPQQEGRLTFTSYSGEWKVPCFYICSGVLSQTQLEVGVSARFGVSTTCTGYYLVWLLQSVGGMEERYKDKHSIRAQQAECLYCSLTWAARPIATFSLRRQVKTGSTWAGRSGDAPL